MASLLSAMQALAPQSQDEADAFLDTLGSTPDVEEFVQKHSKSSKKESRDRKIDIELQRFSEDSDDAEDFFLDRMLDELGADNGDEEFRQGLLSYGRQYNQGGGRSDKEVNDIERRFTPQQQDLKKFISTIDGEIAKVSQDIQNMRMSRSRNFKAMSDLVSAQSSLLSTRLSALKEQSNIQKSILDLTMKAKAKDAESQDAAMTAAAAVQQLIGGGYEIHPDPSMNDPDYVVTTVDESETPRGSGSKPSFDDEAQIKSIFGDTDMDEGTAYIKYEEDGVRLHYQTNPERTNARIVAIDKNGREVPDYPIPGDEALDTMEVFSDIGVAKDSYGREYLLDITD